MIVAAMLLGLVARAPRTHGGDAPPPPAGPAETIELAKKVKVKLHFACFADAAALLDDEARALLAKTPTVAHDLALEIAVEMANALRKDAPSVPTLVDGLRGMASEQDPSPHAAAVRALHALLAALTGRLYERPATVADVRAAVEGLRAGGSKVVTPMPVLFALLRLARLVAERAQTDADAWEAVLVVGDLLRRVEGSRVEIDAQLTTALLERGLLLAPDPAARTVLEQGLKLGYDGRFRSPPRKRVAGDWPEDTAMYNRAVTAAKRLGGAAKFPFAADDFQPRSESVHAKIPALSGWTWSSTGSDQDHGKIVRDRPGVDRVEIQIWGYNGWTEYKSPDGTMTPGENLDGFLKKAMKADRDSLTGITRDTRTSDALNASIQATKGYELKGLGPDGTPTRYRNWFFNHTRMLKRYFNVALTQTGSYDEKDPQVLHILETMVTN